MDEVPSKEETEVQINETSGEIEVMAQPAEETSSEIDLDDSFDMDAMVDNGDAEVAEVQETPGNEVANDHVGEDHAGEPVEDLTGGEVMEANGAVEGSKEEVAGDNDLIDDNGEAVESDDSDVDLDDLVADGGAQGNGETFVDEPASGSGLHLQPVDLEAGLNNNQKEQAPGAVAENGDANEDEEDKPLVEKELEEKKEINPKFKDVHETGNWGEISDGEKYGVIFCVVVAAIVLVVVILNLSSDSDSVDEVDVPKLTSAPTPTPSLPSPEAKLKAIARVWGEEPLFQPLLEELPNQADDYVDQQQNKDAPDRVRALSWLLYEDPVEDLEEEIGTRYALATLYYAFGGENWVNSTNWLTDAESCDWHGVQCDVFRTFVQEIDLSTNNMIGTLPNEVAMFPEMQVLALRDNQLNGTLPVEALGTLTDLFILYLQDNLFTGPIPDNLYDAETLAVFFIQGNEFEGDFPPAYCDRTSSVFREFGLDCVPNPCNGCCTDLNCYDD